MTKGNSGPDRLGALSAFCLHEQLPAEARQMGEAARQLRRVRRAAGYSRRQLAARLGVMVDIVVAIENGYGSLVVAQPLLARARRLGPQA